MLRPLLCWLALAAGQAEPPPADTPPEPPAAPASSGPERWALMHALQGTWPGWLLDGHCVRVVGWTEVSYTLSSASKVQLPEGFNYRTYEPTLQQHWLRIDLPVRTEGTTDPSFGFRSDWILPGTDYRFTLPRGILNGQLTANDGQPNTYGIDPVHFYAEAYFPTLAAGTSLRVGRFPCQYGVEQNAAVDNALWSHAYTFIYNPFTHTGLLATSKLDDTWTVQAGLVLGSDVFIDPASEATFIGSVKWAPPNGRDTVTFAVILGSGRFNEAEAFNNPQVFDLVWTRKLDERLNWTLNCLYGYQNDVPGIGTASWLGVVNYLTCTLTERLNGTARLEFFDDGQGQRTGFEGLYSALTVGLSWKPCRSVTLRPEVRYDYQNRSRPFEDRHWLLSGGLDVIVRW